MKYAHPEHVETLIRKIMERFGKPEEEVRPMVVGILNAEGYTIGIPVELEMHEVSVRAGEQVVIENLKRIEQGLPHAAHAEMIQDIKHAQMRAREDVVVRHLPRQFKRSHLTLVRGK